MKDEALIPFGNKACGSKYYEGSIPGTGEGGVLLILAVEVRNGVTERGEESVFLLGIAVLGERLTRTGNVGLVAGSEARGDFCESEIRQ